MYLKSRPQSSFSNLLYRPIAVLALAAALASALPVQAQPPTELFFSEYVEGSSNNKAIEIFNGTGAPVNLATYDVLISTNGGPAYLYRNDGGSANNWLTLKLRGSESNASALGAIIRVASAGGEQWQAVKSGSSYCSQSQLALTFGIGQDPDAEVTIEWPSGKTEKLGKLKANRWVFVTEGKGAAAD